MANISYRQSCSPIGCLTTTTTIGPACKNPYIHLFYEVIGLTAPGVGSTRKSTIPEVLDRILDKGIFLQGECELCCPDCNNIHFIASVETGNKILFGGWGTNSWDPNQTCQHVNTFSGSCGNNKYFCGISDFESACDPSGCCNGFQEGFDGLMCLAEQTTHINGFNSSVAEVFDRIMDKGVVEYGTINGESQIKHFVEWLSQVPYWTDIAGSNGSSYAEVIDRILDKGIVTWCDGNGGFGIASVETYIKSLPCDGNYIYYDGERNPCCLNIKASIETYGKYLSGKECNESGCAAAPLPA